MYGHLICFLPLGEFGQEIEDTEWPGKCRKEEGGDRGRGKRLTLVRKVIAAGNGLWPPAGLRSLVPSLSTFAFAAGKTSHTRTHRDSRSCKDKEVLFFERA